MDDFIACARHLVEGRWTSSSHLTAYGRSAGGLLVGGAITREPSLFAAAILAVPIVNLLRFEETPGGPANAEELGTTASPSNVSWMLASDPFYRIRQGVSYPAVMLTGSISDIRVPIWQPAKLAAMEGQFATERGAPLRIGGWPDAESRTTRFQLAPSSSPACPAARSACSRSRSPSAADSS